MVALCILIGCKSGTKVEHLPVFKVGDVPTERIVQADKDPENWLTYSGNFASHRFSLLDQIDTATVKNLRVSWVYQTSPGLVETTPIVVDGVMYITEPPSTVTALDTRTGRKLWTWSPSMPDNIIAIGFPSVNRGVAVLDESVFVGTLNAHLVALDARSGAVRWDVTVADNAKGYAITSAPMAVQDKIVIGVSGGETGIRGFLDAYDSKTGSRAWRFWTVPEPGQKGSETWGGESSRTGAGATWIPGAYDPDLNLLYWGIGNPGPDWNGDSRPGDNLYTCSVVALNPTDGNLEWYFQFTPHDLHDWDSNQIPVLINGNYKGKVRKLMAFANRNAFYYLLDRETGEYLQAVPYAKQTWAERIDENGRPVLLPNTEPSVNGTLVYPSLQGATNWFSPSFSKVSGLFFVAVREMGSNYFKSEVAYKEGQQFLGGGEQALDGDQAKGCIRALDAFTGQKKWEFSLLSPPWAGVMSTAGGLVFGGTNEGNFFALDAQTGKELWNFQTGGAVRSNPISFGVDGKQYIGIAAGRAIYTFSTP